MKLGFLRDPVFRIGCVLYAANRWLVKPWTDSTFLHSWFNDLLLAACAIPVLLTILALLKLRASEKPVSLGELSWILVSWSLLFEWLGPGVLSMGTADPIDVVMYFAGGLICWGWWNRRGHSQPA